MRKSALTAFGLIMATSPLVAQTAMSPAPIPGPYQIIIRPQVPAPAMRPQQQPYSQPMPYWMQVQRPNGAQQQTAQAPAPQQPFISGWNWSQPPQGAGARQGYGAAPTPGYFPGYATGQNGQQSRQQRPAPNYGQPAQPNPRQNYGYGGQPWGPQGFMPWGNNAPYGYGYQPGYGRPQRPQRQ